MRGKPINVNEAKTACALVAAGHTQSEVATAMDRSVSGLFRALRETWADDYEEALGRRNDLVRNKVWQLGMEQTQDAPTMRWALDHLVKWHLPEGRETTKVEVSAPDGGPIQVEGRAVVGLADVVALARDLGVGHLVGIDAGDSRPALPSAEDVLPGS